VSKRAKTEIDDDGELEIDVQNDDAASSSARPSSTTHANGTSHKKSGRESAQSISSRDSSATPKSKQNANNQAAMAGKFLLNFLCKSYLKTKFTKNIFSCHGQLNASGSRFERFSRNDRPS
jgi:hypothetical protein